MKELDFETAVTKYSHSLKPFALSLTKNMEDAEDLLQDKKRSTIIDTTDELHYINSGDVLIKNKAESDIGMENVMQAINLISEDFRVPFMMHYQGFKYHEIADHLTLPIGTVKSRIHFARKILQKKLNRW